MNKNIKMKMLFFAFYYFTKSKLIILNKQKELKNGYNKLMREHEYVLI